jgi:malate/lactate dehydrogenase
VKQPVEEMIGELIDEINNVYTQIAEQAIEHIHAKEVIMTYGVSKTVMAFLKEVLYGLQRLGWIVCCVASPSDDCCSCAPSTPSSPSSPSYVAFDRPQSSESLR